MRPGESEAEPVVKLHRVYPAALPPMRADTSGLGTLPAGPFQYCEPLRTASAFGWYVFPPVDIRLAFDGTEAHYESEGEWRLLTSVHLEDEFLDHWDAHAPVDMKGRAPPYLSMTFVPGIIQIWSGFFVSTAPGWSVLVRPPANLAQSRTFSCFEGMIETDRFKPCPLFINIRLLSTDRETIIPKLKPLFQLQPIRRDCYADATLKFPDFAALARESGNAFGMNDEDWQGVRRTLRSADPLETEHTTGDYAARARRRARREGE
jgi:hypothetical protein